LEPVLQGLLTKDPAARTDAAAARQQLSAVLAGAPADPPPAPPAAPAPLPGGSVERLDADDLRKLASASKALLTSVARDARDQARYLNDRRRGRTGAPTRPPTATPTATPRRRLRFKRRWVVVPLVVTLVIVVLVLVGVGLLVAGQLGLL